MYFSNKKKKCHLLTKAKHFHSFLSFKDNFLHGIIITSSILAFKSPSQFILSFLCPSFLYVCPSICPSFCVCQFLCVFQALSSFGKWVGRGGWSRQCNKDTWVLKEIFINYFFLFFSCLRKLSSLIHTHFQTGAKAEFRITNGKNCFNLRLWLFPTKVTHTTNGRSHTHTHTRTHTICNMIINRNNNKFECK